jgi:hypothetical protein
MPDMNYAHFKDFSSSGLPFEEKKKVWLEISDMTEEAFDAMMAANKARQSRVPQVGTPAPDFEIERLDRDRKRSGERVRLSALKGRPVALVFGSYT